MISLRRFIIASVAVASTVNAQCDKGAEIQSNGDVEKYSSCSTIKGDVVIGTGVTELSMPEVQRIDGDLTIKGATGLSSIDCPKLGTIEGIFTLEELTILSNLNMPALGKVGSLSWTGLPGLSEPTFTSKITEAENVLISNTIIESIAGISLTSVKNFDINNNKYLNSIESKLGNVTEVLSITSNSGDSTYSFPDLVWARNITIRSASSVSFPRLEAVNNSMNIDECSFETMDLPALTEVGQSLGFSRNQDLKNVSANNLELVGGALKLANNTELKIVDSFDKLKTVQGAIDFAGVFTNVTLPSLKDVRGGFNLQSISTIDCSAFDKVKGSVIKGTYTCKGKLSEAKNKDGSTSTTGGSGEGEDEGNAASGRVGISAVAFLAAVAAALL